MSCYVWLISEETSHVFEEKEKKWMMRKDRGKIDASLRLAH